MRRIFDTGITPAQAKSNPALIATNPFVENMFPALTNLYFPGSASANYYFGVYGTYAGSDMDHLHSLDRLVSPAFPNCIVVTGCFTFYGPQISFASSWANAGSANYHGMIVSLRRALRKGVSFDVNYTWSHSIDNASVAASGSFTDRSTSINTFRPGLSRDSSDFDLRHLINANVLYSLPIGKGRMLLGNASKWVDALTGGWQISAITYIRSGLPSTMTGLGGFSTNLNNGNQAIQRFAEAPKTGSVKYDQFGTPSLFTSTTMTSAYKDYDPGGVAQRGIVRMPWFRNVDASVMKVFPTPWERHTIQLRGEAFNLFNNVNFASPSLALSSPGTFGQFGSAEDARVLQLALRYSF